MTPPELRELWRELFGTFPPHVNRAYLQRRLAYRIQELAMGGGSEAIDKRLDTLDKQKQGDRAQKSSRYLKISPGTKLIREYKGVEHLITALPDGQFEHNGKRYAIFRPFIATGQIFGEYL